MRLDPAGDVVQSSGPQSALTDPSVLLRGHELGLLQQSHVLHHPGQRDPGPRREVADRGGAETETLGDLSAGPGREGGGRSVPGGKLNHMVNCMLVSTYVSTSRRPRLSERMLEATDDRRVTVDRRGRIRLGRSADGWLVGWFGGVFSKLADQGVRSSVARSPTG